MRPHTISAVGAGLLALAVQAHIILETPKPYIFAAYGPSNPIEPTGSDYPCKIPPGVSKLEIDGAPTVMAIGEAQTMSFTGLAVHGGGSCQISLTPGFEPNRQSQFSVIHSIEGGCPAINQKGNLNDGQSPDTYQYTIPDAVEPGNYTLAWTWVNRISGGTEFYMNCAPIAVTGGGGGARRSRRTEDRQAQRAAVDRRDGGSFPGMFMANMGDASGGCLTTEAMQKQLAIAYPHPGDSVDHPEGTANLIQQTCDGNPLNSGAGATGGSGDASSVATPSTTAETISSTTPATTSEVEQSPAPATSTTPEVSAPPVSTTTAATTDSAKSETSTSIEPSAPTSTEVPEGSCTEGYLLCLTTQFSTCTGGKWTQPQPLAPGTHCTGGAGVGLTIVNPV